MPLVIKYVVEVLILVFTLTNVKLEKYRATDFVAPGAGKLQMVYTPADGSAATVMDVYNFQGSGVAMTMYNTDEVSHILVCHHRSLFEHCDTVYCWIRSCIVQDGSEQEDASSTIFLTMTWSLG